MSKYTTEVRFICENYSGLLESVGYTSVNSVIKTALPKVFDFDFPIFDEEYREVLCGKILKHYYTREICEETVGLWKFRLETKLNEIMPYYNQLYKSTLLEFNPFYDIDVTTTHSGDKKEDVNRTNTIEGTGTSHGTTSSDRTDYNLFSETPQGSLVNLESGEYLTNATKQQGNNNVESNANTTSNTNGTEVTALKNLDNYINVVKGKNGGKSYSEMLMEFRKTFLNIDMMIIEELEPLFFGLW